uniref:Uncharacterized protein n=1 Tax=Triticum urartu TaxID=4572 RepID=A0A8R7R4U0_TRIUA
MGFQELRASGLCELQTEDHPIQVEVCRMSLRVPCPPDPWWRRAKSCQLQVQACDMNPQFQAKSWHLYLQRLEGRWPDYHRLELLEASRPWARRWCRRRRRKRSAGASHAT